MSEDLDQAKIPFTDLVSGLTTEPLEDGDTVVSVFCIVKAQDPEGDPLWAARAGGETLAPEELLGVLRGLAASIEKDLADEWEW